MAHLQPPFSETDLEGLGRALESAATHAQLGGLFEERRLAEPQSEANWPKWKRIKLTLIEAQRSATNGNPVMSFIALILRPARFVQTPDRFVEICESTNLVLAFYGNPIVSFAADVAEGPRYGAPQVIHPRLGQGAFRVEVTDAYSRRCAITGERTLPALEAGHIRPYSKQGPHQTNNGILLRSDLHNLFDLGYLTVTLDLKVEVSRRIKEEFENGRHYYDLHGETLKVVPRDERARPAREFIEWRNAIFKG